MPISCVSHTQATELLETGSLCTPDTQLPETAFLHTQLTELPNTACPTVKIQTTRIAHFYSHATELCKLLLSTPSIQILCEVLPSTTWLLKSCILRVPIPRLQNS
ncbi:hypothetical protein QR98_0097820 [Sarcoptes scabiei]|uniref:Uncharacterized protein n=1 Tax=Sarcoptes scabiei TaxID=52283 RepID=A0A132AJP3_SARSC|nr:hypothetical protein QR98_0097820 [Sarcoptes scabiei]